MTPAKTLAALVLLALLAGLGLAPTAPGWADDEAKPAEAEAEKTAKTEPEHQVVTEHTVTIGGEKVTYEARAGTIDLATEEGKKKASVFFIAYTRKGVDDVAKRPLTFSFNGGPGSSSVWLHLGAFGPKRVHMDAEGNPLPPPYRLVENEHSILDLTDLVFIDPVSTGYSRAAKGENAGQFHGINEDAESVAEFIRLYTTRFERWSSPKFLAGESYGTTRAAALSGVLQDEHGIYLNGIVLVSSILDFQTARFNRGNDLPFILFLPTYTATAWHHKQLDAELQKDLRKTLDEVEAFARGEYTLALMKGDRLGDAERDAIATKLARYTGLSKEYVLSTNLRINISRFCKELRRDERRTVGRLDSRFVGMDYDAAADGYEFDPSYAAIQGPYTGTLNDYVRSELGYESDLPYEILTGRVQPWSYKSYQNRYVNVAETLRSAMTKNRALRVYVANGYFDLATPYFATEYTFDHLGLEPELRDHVSMGYYESGHMMYIQIASLKKLKDELVAFYAKALDGQSQ